MVYWWISGGVGGILVRIFIMIHWLISDDDPIYWPICGGGSGTIDGLVICDDSICIGGDQNKW